MLQKTAAARFDAEKRPILEPQGLNFRNTHFYDVFRSGNSKQGGATESRRPRVFQQKLKSTHIYEVFRILFFGVEEAPGRRGGRGGGTPPPLGTSSLTA